MIHAGGSGGVQWVKPKVEWGSLAEAKITINYCYAAGLDFNYNMLRRVKTRCSGGFLNLEHGGDYYETIY